MKKPTILHTEASNGWGGQEIRVLSEMLGMKGRGYGVILATPGNTRIFGRAMEAGLDVLPLDMGRSGFIRGIAGLVRIIKGRGVSIINTHSSRDSWMGAIAGRLAGVKVLRTRHISSELKKDPLTRLVYGPFCDGIITTGEFIKAQLASGLGIKPEKIRSIPTGIDVESFAAAKGDEVRAGLGIPGNAPVIGIAAALRSWKGHAYILRAMPGIIKAFPDARLLAAGEGPMRPEIEDEIKRLGLDGPVILAGHREDVAEVVASFDIAVMASYASEGIPQFALQAMAAGKPVVGTRTGGIPEVVQDGVNGILIPPREPAAITDAVKKLLSDPASMKKMGEAGRRMARERHTTDRMLDGIESLYEAVLKDKE